jgi:ribosomal protein S6
MARKTDTPADMPETEMQDDSQEMGAVQAHEVENSAEPRVYELGFHLDGELPQEDSKKAYESIKALISKNGTVVAEGTPQKIQLAYTISRMDTTGRRDFNTSFFCWIVYEADGTGHDAVQEVVKADTKIIRFIDLRTTKDAAKHAEEMHEFYMKIPEQPVEVEEDSVAEAELDAALKEVGAAV